MKNKNNQYTLFDEVTDSTVLTMDNKTSEPPVKSDKAAFQTIEKYPEYKDLGVEWLGKIPQHWKVSRLKFLGKIYSGLSDKKGNDFSKDYSEGMKPYIPFTNICNNVKISEEQYHFVRVNDKENQNRVLKNDILFLMSSETLEDIAKCSIYLGNNIELYLNSFCKGFRIQASNINPVYINYLLSSSTYRGYFSLVGRGFTRINLRQEFINDVFTLLPTLQEQSAIAAFLDRKITQIDKAIDIKEKQIELLKERRQLLIHNTVTRGLNLDAPIKDSGIDMLGRIPDHWELKQVKFILQERNEKSISGEEPLFMVSQKYGLVVRADYHEKAEVAQSNVGNKIVYKSDLVFNKLKAHLGVFFKSDIDYKGLVSPDYAVYYSNGIIEDLKYLEYLFRHPAYIKQFICKATGIVEGLIRLYTGDLFGIKVPVPPKEEQKEILLFIEAQTDKFDKAISLAKTQIEKLKEYKTTLINSVVTGKIKVS